MFLEANAYGKPVIGGEADAMIDIKPRILVDGSTPESIAAAIVDLLTDDTKRHSMGKAGFEWAKANDVKIKAAEILECCESLLV